MLIVQYAACFGLNYKTSWGADNSTSKQHTIIRPIENLTLLCLKCFYWPKPDSVKVKKLVYANMLASGTQDREFDPGQGRRIFRAKKSTAFLPWGGSKAVSHVADLRGMSKNPGFTWESKSQAKLTGNFSPVIPSFADRGLSCRLHVEAPRGESGNV